MSWGSGFTGILAVPPPSLIPPSVLLLLAQTINAVNVQPGGSLSSFLPNKSFYELSGPHVQVGPVAVATLERARVCPLQEPVKTLRGSDPGSPLTGVPAFWSPVKVLLLVLPEVERECGSAHVRVCVCVRAESQQEPDGLIPPEFISFPG